MRILYIGAFRFPNGDAAASRVLNNARVLRDLGHQVTIISFGGHYRVEDLTEDGYVFDSLRYIISQDIDTHSFKERAERYICPYPNCRKWMKTNVSYYDSVIVYGPTFALNCWLIKFCKKHRKSLICDITEWYAASETPGGKLSPIYWCSEWNMKHTLKRISRKILISNYLNRLYPESENIIVPPLINVLDPKWHQDISVIDNRTIKAHQGIRILYAGTPANKELLGNLIYAMLLLLDKGEMRIQLVVAGVSPEQASSMVKEDARLGQYSKNLVFLGRIPQEMVAAYYRMCDFSAIIRERTRKNMAGFPTKMAESMAGGCPVILTDTSDLSQYAKDGENAIIIDDVKVETIANALVRVRGLSSQDIANMKSSARKTAESKFDYRNYLSEINNIIQ